MPTPISFQKMFLGALVLGATPLAAQKPAAPAQAQPSYYFCFAYTEMRGTMWVTPLHPLGPDIDALDAAWGKKVRAEFIPTAGQRAGECPFGSAEDMETHKKSLPSKLRITKLVDVDWSYWKDAESPEAVAKLNQAAAAGQFVLCYSDPGQSPVYFSADIHIDVPAIDPQSNKNDGGASARAIDGLKAEYLAYLKKSHGYKTSSAFPVYCQGGSRSAAELALIKEGMHQRPQLKLMETGWLPGSPQMAAPAAATASAPAPAPAPPPKGGAPKPAATPPPAPPPPPPPPVDDGHTYAYCFDNGYPPRAPNAAGHTIYYVSDMFTADASTHPGPAFEQVLRAAHPNEKIGSATCTTPQKLATAQKTRDAEIVARERNPYITVVQVHWKP